MLNCTLSALQESVLHLKQEEMPANQVDEPKSAVHYNIKPQLLHRLGTSQKQLENSILKFESVIGQLEEIWDLKVSVQGVSRMAGNSIP